MTLSSSNASRASSALVFLVLLLWAERGLNAQAAVAPRQASVHQLRTYEIFEHNQQAFHDRFRDHAMRIMAKYDFRIVSIWEARTAGRTEFMYLLEWPDRKVMEDRWAAFMADKEWAEIKRQTAALHGQVVGRIESREMTVTPYSPRAELLALPARSP